jgi:hypothetical protein
MSERLAWTIALLCMCAGIGWVTATGWQAKKGLAVLAGQGQRLAELQQLEGLASHTRAAISAVDRAIKAEPADLRTLTGVYLPGTAIQWLPVEDRMLADGWRLRRQTLRFEALTGAELGLLIQKAENQRPPWRLESLELEPGEGETLRGELCFQTLKKRAKGT